MAGNLHKLVLFTSSAPQKKLKVLDLRARINCFLKYGVIEPLIILVAEISRWTPN